MITEKLYKEYVEQVKGLEGFRSTVYLDSKGVPTVGYGYALMVYHSGIEPKWVVRNQKALRKVGLNLKDEEYKIIEKYAYAKSSNEPLGSLRSQIESIGIRIDTNTAEGLTRSAIDEAHNTIVSSIGQKTWNGLSHGQQMGVMDRCYQHGNIKPLAKHIISGNTAKVAETMRNDVGYKARAEHRAYLYENDKVPKYVHVVQSGESFGKIARKHSTTQDNLKKLNPGIDVNRLHVWQHVNVRQEIGNSADMIKPGEELRAQRTDAHNVWNRGYDWTWYSPLSWIGKVWNGASSGIVGTYRSSEMRHRIFEDYRPKFTEFSLFPSVVDGLRFHETPLVNEPSWLYRRPGTGEEPEGYIKKVLKELDLKDNILKTFREEAKLCLLSLSCTETVSTLLDTVARKYSYTPWAMYDKVSVIKEAHDIAQDEAESSVWMWSMLKSATFGMWTNTLREELGYAASHVSPLVLDLNGDGVKLVPYTRGVYFDIDNDGFAERVGWLSEQDGHLARDLNKNGRIDDITELFGDDLISAFFKLSLSDSNGDKVIDDRDEDFKELLIWQDKNTNGYSEAKELRSLKDMGIKSISLHTEPDNRIIEGNTITSKSNFTYTDGRQGEVADVHYHNDDMDSWYKGKVSDYKMDEDKYFGEIERFRKEVLEELSSKVEEPGDTDKRSDWVAAVIEEIAVKYINRHKEQHAYGLQEVLQKLETKNVQGRSESLQVCKEGASRLVEEVSEERIQKQYEIVSRVLNATIQNRTNITARYTQEYLKAKDELLNEINDKLAQEKKDINAQKTQEYQEKLKGILAGINVQSKQKAEELYQSVLGGRLAHSVYAQVLASHKAHFVQEYETQKNTWKAFYEGEATREIGKAVKRYSEEYQKQLAIVKERYTKGAREEVDAVNGNYTKWRLTGLEQESEELKNATDSKLSQVLHTHMHSCVKEKEGIRGVLHDQYLKHKDAGSSVLEGYSVLIKQEANKIYQFFTTRIARYLEELYEEESGSYFFGSGRHVSIDTVPEWLEDECFKERESGANNDDMGVKIDPETLFMPLIRGYGKISSLHISMTHNPRLKKLVSDLMVSKLSELNSIYDRVIEILYEWAGVSDIEEDERATAEGINIEARKVAFVERFTGQDFRQLGAAKFVGQHASTAVQKAYDIGLVRITKNLLVQGPFLGIFPNAEYSFIDDSIKLNASLTEIICASKELALRYDLGHDFWIQLSYILSQSLGELDVDLRELKSRLSEAAGEEMFVDSEDVGLVGNESDNIIKGSLGSDYIKGLGGHDKLYGKERSDHLDGGEGSDELFGGQGIDRLYGGGGNDKVYGGDGRDFIYGEGGNDQLYGEDGDDHIEGGSGGDTMDGGAGVNTLSYGTSPIGVHVSLLSGVQEQQEKVEGREDHASGDVFRNFQNLGGSEYNDHLLGDADANHINGEGGDDTIEGLGGNDRLFGATGNDRLLGGEGDDVLSGFDGPDHMDGGEGRDTAHYNHPYSTVGVVVDLSRQRGTGGYAHEDSYISIENVIGSKYRDVIQGDAGNNVLQGMEGDDDIKGADGDDVIYGGRGFDKLLGEEGNDEILLTGDGDHAVGGAGKDSVSYRLASKGVTLNLRQGIGSTHGVHQDKLEEFENVVGSQFDDNIEGDAQANVLYGGKGDDALKGGCGADTISGGEGKDKINGEEGDDIILGDEGEDEIDGGAGIDIVDYSKELASGIKVDLVFGRVSGGIGQNDRLKNIEGVIGTKFNDVLIGGDGNDLLFGGDGDDEIRGGKGNDQLSGGTGKNTIDGGEGNDLCSYASSQEGINVNLSEGKGFKKGIYEDIYTDIEGIIGSRYNDRIIGDDNSNQLFGGDGDDYINGGGWSDKISGGKGNNVLDGGTGRDEFFVAEGSNEVDGGDGNDTANYVEYRREEFTDVHGSEFAIRLRPNLLPQYVGQAFSTPPVSNIPGLVINLVSGKVVKPMGLKDMLSNIENVIGSHFNDTLIGDDTGNDLDGGNGSDTIYGGGGDDRITCGWGMSSLYGGDGNDYFMLKGFTAGIEGGEGRDLADFMNIPISVDVNLKEGYVLYNDIAVIRSRIVGIEGIMGSRLNDTIRDDDGDNIIAGGSGDDKIYVTMGKDSVNGQEGNDTIYVGGNGSKEIWGGSFDADTFVITKDFKAQDRISSVIVDFDAGAGGDKIDLREFGHLKTMEDLRLEEFTHDGKGFIVASLSHESWISLYGVDINKLTNENFIFASDGLKGEYSEYWYEAGASH
ncbi:LysM peptidoglycan-binding domain-containing protein [Rickettsiales endosymbiont of Peranema trichophorum]|uniref:LysM peptidoglycan-binding domain-containing protein n=1 Tax=Rickettsiales endosymbiont of Peranema trichophorum TaxID=2486577 RepID=UPI001022ED2B|nr:LysM peptidoglycan-binding domain-containing protein [Rickettsiales endosymbiont of Peranema trichophorum]RZI47407.1 LysM peptidoglycan-binding domain-containing protein [Rickettsiales endosymbiont of Peranema trichophorum]